MPKKVLWWGRSDREYSRNRVLRNIFRAENWQVLDFHPRFSALGHLESGTKPFLLADLVWVPCFRQRDVPAAVKWAHKNNKPVVFDPLISAYDKQVFERDKYPESSFRARRLMSWEKHLFQSVDVVFADTWEHARFYQETLGVNPSRLAVVPVGAEDDLFRPLAMPPAKEAPPCVLFYGSFLNLHGPEFIMEAVRRYSGPPIRWIFIGQGPLLDDCRKMTEDLPQVEFLPWLPYEDLPAMIHGADILLGIFGTTAKAGRVIPNKVYQALACGKPLITRSSPAYPDHFPGNRELGIAWVPPGNAQAIADRIAELMSDPAVLEVMGRQARRTYETYFSSSSISDSLFAAIKPLLPA